MINRGRAKEAFYFRVKKTHWDGKLPSPLYQWESDIIMSQKRTKITKITYFNFKPGVGDRGVAQLVDNLASHPKD